MRRRCALNNQAPFRVVISGIGGFASSHHANFAELEREGRVRVVATCDPALDRLGEACVRHGFAQRGIATHSSFEGMLEAHRGEIDFGVVATPIPCHAPMHRSLVERGIACYLEKPPTLDPTEFAAMLECERSARIPTHVGFSFVELSDRLALKARMVAGEFGKPLEFSFLGLTSRKPTYFRRSNWAGRLRLGGGLVLDSCLGNAMAHFLNNMLFLSATDSVESRARPLDMECELYRANAIEGCDTIFARCGLNNGTTLRLAASHACENAIALTEERLVFENAKIVIQGAKNVSIAWGDGRAEVFEIQAPALKSGLAAYLEFLEGRIERPPQSLADCRGFVEANALFYLAAEAIHTVAPAHLSQACPDFPIAIENIEPACRAMVDEGTPPSCSNMAWGRRGGKAVSADLPNLGAAVELLAFPEKTD